jgi:hypothetical protein
MFSVFKIEQSFSLIKKGGCNYSKRERATI